MRSPADRLRSALEAWREDESRSRVARWRGAPEGSAADCWERHERLATDRARELLEETVGLGLVTPDEHGALVAHLARFSAEGPLAHARDTLDGARGQTLSLGGDAYAPGDLVHALVREPDPGRRASMADVAVGALDTLVGALLDARDEADAAAAPWLQGAPRHADAGPPPSDLAARAHAFLRATEAVAQELVEWSFRSIAVRGDREWQDLVYACSGPLLVAVLPDRDRWRRVASLVRGLGLARELGQRVHVEPAHGVADPRARVVAASAPLDIRVSASGVASGVIAELGAADAVGRALGLALVTPALPMELRRPAVGSVARTVGVLFAGLHADARVLRRERGLSAREAEPIARHATLATLVSARMAAAAVVARFSTSRSRGERLELAGSLASDAACVRVRPALAALLLLTPSGGGSRARSALAALSLSVALRDRFDEDWYANPRAAEPFRAACARGGALSTEAWCVELGAADALAVARVHELAGG